LIIACRSSVLSIPVLLSLLTHLEFQIAETFVVLGAADSAPFQKESQGVLLAQKQLMVFLRVGQRVPGRILDADVHDDLFLSAGDRFRDLRLQYRTIPPERQEGRTYLLFMMSLNEKEKVI
jgi:hypothetical protein